MTNIRRKVLIAIGDVGAGHRVPASAVQDAIEALYPGCYEVEVFDFFDHLDPFPFKGGSKASVRISSSLPLLRSLNALFWHLSNSRFFHPFERWFVKKRCGETYFRILKEKKPDLVITVHPYLSELLGEWRNSLGFRHAAIVLELGTPMRSSATNAFDLLVSPTRESTRRLCRMGAPEEKVETGLFPFRLDLRSFRSREEMANELGFDSTKPVIVLSGGGISISSLKNEIRRLVAAGRQVLILAGNDDVFAAEIQEQYSATDPVRVVGFVERIQDYYALADVIIAKPGASTVMEIELLRKPCLLTAPVGPQENGNLAYALRNSTFRFVGRLTPFVDLLIEELLEIASEEPASRRVEETKELAACCLSLIE